MKSLNRKELKRVAKEISLMSLQVIVTLIGILVFFWLVGVVVYLLEHYTVIAVIGIAVAIKLFKSKLKQWFTF